MLRKVHLKDAQQLVKIYNYYVLNSVVTFDLVEMTEKQMEQKIKTISVEYPWFVYEENRSILGYAYACQWKVKAAYKQTVESTVYVSPASTQKGLGTKLYSQLIATLKTQNIHAILGGISLPNESSIRLHEKLGFEKVAHFKALGFKFNKWVDVGYWQLINED